MELNYRFKDNDFEETVLLMHGFLSDMSSMEPAAGHLMEHFNILFVDLPGFGDTKAGGDYSMDDVSDALAALIMSRWGAVHVAGYSMGGRVAVSLIINHPGVIKSAVLESASPGISDPAERKKRQELDRKRADSILSDYVSFIDAWEKMGLFQSQDFADAGQRMRQRENRLAQNPYGAAESLINYGTGTQKSYWADLPGVSVPVLLLAGEKDGKFAAINQRMEELIPESRLEIIPGAGHNIHMEAADKFGIIVLEFLIGG
ncbi:2-succinyl-6-hydroxy-2,4-cyclohexadiene-1-carboxylate synthase [Salinicoccus carnicancri]|uniref:2-succinyl-6-hydroxy-2, 4-cyclohexadiene-1-carboxylate synthase n=1 Tax=Salinicoccus carnicancri TaxID=558170 RepID=UPI000318100E|nr:2-succinyl-6-hydroxy-2,4-cyclohexadiene-1-carboxylate synthase [Salinicoccus carnicancri]